MPVPWAQIVRLMPSILELSHELLKRTRRQPSSDAPPGPIESDPAVAALDGRVGRLEENERNQAVLVTNMAEQLEQLTVAVTALHRQWRLLIAGLIVTGVVAVVALIVAVRLSFMHTLP